MNSRKVEWKDGDGWRQIKAKISVTRSGNYTFQHEAKRYVFKNFLEGCQVVVLEGKKWARVGRIDHYGTIFLGVGESYSEQINRANKGKSSEQIMAEIKSFLHPVECPSIDKTQRTLTDLKNVGELELL